MKRDEVFIKKNVKFEYQENSGANFYMDGDNIFFSTKDGIHYVNGEGRAIWKEIFSLTYPIMIGEGNCVLVTENRGNHIYVFNSAGKLYEKELPNPVISVSMNTNGYVSVITEESTGYIILVYDNNGRMVREAKSYTYNVFPICTDISNDNKILAVSYYDVRSLEPVSKLSYFYINRIDDEKAGTENIKMAQTDEISTEKAGAENTETPQTDENSTIKSETQNIETPQTDENSSAKAGQIEKNKMIPIIKFMKDNAFIVVSDKDIAFFRISDNLEFTEKKRITLYNEIDEIYFTNDYNVSIATGKGFLNEESEELGIVRTYDLNGEIIFEKNTENKVTYLSADFNSIIIGNDSLFTAYTNEGKQIWQHNALQPIKQLLFYKNTKNILEAGSIEANILKLIKINSDEYQDANKEENSTATPQTTPSASEEPEVTATDANINQDTENAQN